MAGAFRLVLCYLLHIDRESSDALCPHARIRFDARRNGFDGTKVPELSQQDFENYANSLYAYAKKRVQSDEDIMDLIQDTLLDFLEQQHRFRAEASPLTYLTAILRNKIFHLYRKQNREISVASDELNLMIQTHSEKIASGTSRAGSAPERSAEAREIHKIVEMCVKRLKSPYFEAFVLREIEELSTDEICKILSVTVTNLNVILHRARQYLQKMLRDEGIEKEY